MNMAAEEEQLLPGPGACWSGMAWDGMGRRGKGWGGVGRDGAAWDGMGWGGHTLLAWLVHLANS